MKTYFMITKNILVLFICLISFSLSGQFTTVIPAVDKGAKVTVAGQAVSFSFNLSSIPSSATINSCQMQLTLAENVQEKLTLDVKLSGSRFGYMFLDRSYTANQVFYLDGLPSQIGRSTNTPMTLQVKSEKTTSRVSILGDGNQSPRLIITYSMPPEQPVDWSMSHANGQHSGSTYMRFGGSTPTAFNAKQISAFGDVQSDLVMYKNKIYVIDNASSKTSLYALDPVTKYRTLIADRLLAPVSMPIIDRNGRLFYFSANKVEVIDLENGNARRDVISIGSNRNLNASPTIGPDGSLYLVYNDAVVAYTPYPVVQKIWQHGSPGLKSPVTVNKEGTLAYFATYESNKIISLSTTNGNKLRESLVALIRPSNEGPTIPLVGDDGKVYVTNKLINANKLYVFSSQLGGINTISGSKISLPVSGKGNNVFYVKDGVLHNYTTSQQTPFTGNVAVRSLAGDLSNNVYCLGMDNKMYVYNDVNKQIAQSAATSSAMQRALVVGKDGSIYSASSSTVFGFRITNNSTFSAYTLTSSDNQRNNTTYRGKTLTVPANFSLSKDKILVGLQAVQFLDNSNIQSGSNVIVESANGISFKKGFSVKNGATLSCKTGY